MCRYTHMFLFTRKSASSSTNVAAGICDGRLRNRVSISGSDEKFVSYLQCFGTAVVCNRPPL